MKIAVIGVGHIGENCARQFSRVGHEVMLTYSRDPHRLQRLAEELGNDAKATDLSDALSSADVVVLSVPWSQIDEVMHLVGSFEQRIVIDTTNQFGPGGLIDLHGQTAARYNADRLTGARYTKSFNTLTSAFQVAVVQRPANERVVQWVCGDDTEAKGAVSALLSEIGYEPIDIGGIDQGSVMEAPRRPGAVYGEEYRKAAAIAVAAAVQSGHAIPPTPHYEKISRAGLIARKVSTGP
jgi:8-hydroxy-5-deazaflavin:NADPH oxidoreductase